MNLYRFSFHFLAQHLNFGRDMLDVAMPFASSFWCCARIKKHFVFQSRLGFPVPTVYLFLFPFPKNISVVLYTKRIKITSEIKSLVFCHVFDFLSPASAHSECRMCESHSHFAMAWLRVFKIPISYTKVKLESTSFYDFICNPSPSSNGERFKNLRMKLDYWEFSLTPQNIFFSIYICNRVADSKKDQSCDLILKVEKQKQKLQWLWTFIITNWN